MFGIGEPIMDSSGQVAAYQFVSGRQCRFETCVTVDTDARQIIREDGRVIAFPPWLELRGTAITIEQARALERYVLATDIQASGQARQAEY